MFEQFWSLYPKKVARKEAEKAFGKLKSDERLRALEAIPKHVEYWKATDTDKMYIPHCASWLNGWRFDDEIELPQPKTIEKVWWTSEAGMLAKGREHNTEPRPGETWDRFKQRLTTLSRTG